MKWKKQIGLDNCEKTLEEIALSILSEMVLVYRGGIGLQFKKVKEEYVFEKNHQEERKLPFYL
jgi:xanthine/CO dehydrogenase XdhC/CoxF family maturation factor